VILWAVVVGLAEALSCAAALLLLNIEDKLVSRIQFDILITPKIWWIKNLKLLSTDDSF